MKKLLYFYLIYFPFMFAQAQPVIILDLNNTLFTINTFKFIKTIGFGTLSSYMLKHWKNPVNVCLDILDRMSKEPNQIPPINFYFLNKPMPKCIVELYLGEKESRQVLTEVISYINQLDKKKYFYDKQEKKLIEAIAYALIEKENIAAIIQPMQNVAQLIKELKSKKYTVYALSNMTREGFEVYCAQLPSLQTLFDEIFLSYQVNHIKPETEMYQQVLTKNSIKPENCVAIESCQEYCTIAQKLGIKTILHSNIRKTKSQLKKLGIIV